ncbi:MAG: DNA-protecting protein DprA [Bacteroidia bacterium]|nr:DNA-protecting protein DprA [Bacteroidia bacterium]
MDNELQYNIGLTLIPFVGDITAKNLIAYCGSSEAVFKETKENLLMIPGIGEITADAITRQQVLDRALEEIKIIEKEGIKPIFYTDKDYPIRLKQCDDGPLMIYYRGSSPLSADRVIAIVGTRHATAYGKRMTAEIVEGLKETGALIVSGLAFGIDICAHRSALDAGLNTIAVVAHGQDIIYPAEHTNVANRMLQSGGIVTEFLSNTPPNRENFPKRNRIIAGLSDATLVIESKEKGGALITADIAFSYSREVIACPGKADDIYSRGCNNLIQRNKAALVQSAEDVINHLGWKEEKNKHNRQTELFQNLPPEEAAIVETLKASGVPMYIDDLALKLNITPGNISAHLLSLEFSGILVSHPGKMYSL